MGGRAPGYRLSPDHFQNVKRMLAPDWAQKMLCIIVPNRWTVSPEFFLWVRTRRLLSCHSCLVRLPSFPNYWWVEERFGCYQREQFNLHWENSVSDGSQCIVNNRKFKMQRRRESKKSNGLIRQNNNFARASRFFVHFFAVTARLGHMRIPNFTFCERSKQAMTKFSFSVWTWIWLIEIQRQRRSLAFDKVSELE